MTAQTEAEQPAPAPRKRRPGIATMSLYLMDMRRTLRLKTITTPTGETRLRTAEDPQEDGARAVIEITPEDAEMLEAITDALEFFAVKWTKWKVADKNWPLIEAVLKQRGLL